MPAQKAQLIYFWFTWSRCRKSGGKTAPSIEFQLIQPKNDGIYSQHYQISIPQHSNDFTQVNFKFEMKMKKKTIRKSGPAEKPGQTGKPSVHKIIRKASIANLCGRL